MSIACENVRFSLLFVDGDVSILGNPGTDSGGEGKSKRAEKYGDSRQPEVVFFFSFFDGGFTQMFGQMASIIVKTLRNANLVASRCFKMKKISLPFDVRSSKTPLFKLCIICFCHLLSRVESYFSLQ